MGRDPPKGCGRTQMGDFCLRDISEVHFLGGGVEEGRCTPSYQTELFLSPCCLKLQPVSYKGKKKPAFFFSVSASPESRELLLKCGDKFYLNNAIFVLFVC